MEDAISVYNTSRSFDRYKVIYLDPQELLNGSNCDIIPPLPKGVQREIQKDVESRGITSPIICTASRVIVDGYLRRKIAINLNIQKVPVIIVELSEEEQIRERVSLNLMRRHLTDDQRAILAAREMEALTHLRQRERSKRANDVKYGRSSETNVIPKERLRKSLSNLCNVSERKIMYAAKIQAENPSRLEEVFNGNKSLIKTYQKFVREYAPKAPPLPDDLYSVILADPPWMFSSSTPGGARAIENFYPTMTLKEIIDLPVENMSYKNCVLFLWVPSSLIPDALKVVEEWGFVYKNIQVWDKSVQGIPNWLKSTAEFLIIAGKGNVGLPSKLPPQIYREKRGKHSKKPEKFYTFIEQMFPDAKRLELFARNHRTNWTSWGNQLPEYYIE